MSYSLSWEGNAYRIVDGLSDPSFAAAIIDGGERLAAAPTRLSRRNGHPFYGRDQRYSFEVAGRIVTLFFQFGQDEQTLYIRDVAIHPPIR